MKKAQVISEEKCLCPVETTTTNQQHFQKYDNVKILPKAGPPKYCDIELISGHFQNNLQFNGQQIKSKAWPGILQNSEEYINFLNRLESCKKEIFNLYFRLPAIDKKVIGEMFNNLNKTAYQLVFSPNNFFPLSEKRRYAKLERQPLFLNYEETTYRTYFNHINELELFRDILRGVAFKDNKEGLRIDLKTMGYCGRSTYADEISALGKVYAKPTLTGPVDRYTLRKI